MTPRSALDMPALDFAVEALGCERSGAICVEHPSAGERFCPEATRLAALIEARDAQIRADECEQAAESLGDLIIRFAPRTIAGALRARATQHRGDKP